MKENNYLNILAVLKTQENLDESYISKEELLTLQCFILLLKKRNALNSDYEVSLYGFDETFQKLVENTNDENINRLYKVGICQIVKSINVSYLSELISIFNRIEDSFIKENGSSLVETLLEGFFSNQRFGSDALQPKEISKIINHFAGKKNALSYFNPFAGLGSLAINLPDNFTYLGEELSSLNQVLGNIRMLIHNCPSHFKLKEADSIKNFVFEEKYDFIAFNPPFNIKLRSNEYDEISEKNEYFSRANANTFIVSECLGKLKEGGKMVFVMPNSFLFSRSTIHKKFRKFLVTNGYIETIISLPSNVLSFSSISVNIIVVSKTKNKYAKVRFLDATKLYVTQSNKQNLIDSNKVIELIESNRKSEWIKNVSLEEIAENDYDLSVNRFVTEDLGLSENESKELVKLNDLISIVKADKFKVKTGKLVKIKDLASDIIDNTKTFNNLEETELKKDANLLKQDTLLLSLAHNNLKPTLYKKEKENIYYSRDFIFACIINNDKVNSDYLVLELHKEYVERQINSKKLGTAIQRVLKEDLLNIKIVIPTLAEQLIKVNTYRASIISKKQEDFKQLVKNYGLDVADENSFLRHQIAGTLKNVRGAFKAILQIVNEKIEPQIPEVLDFKRNENLQQTLKDYLDIMERDLTSINNSINVVGQSLDLIDLKTEKFDVLKFLKNYVSEINSRTSNIFEISLDPDEELLKEKEVSKVYIFGDKEFLRRIFDNIIENAVKHGFEGKLNQNNKIRIDLLYNFEDSNIQVDFTNTGKPLPEDFTHEAYTRKGSKLGANAGNGIGGWFINEVMKLHNGSLSIIDETGSEGIGLGNITTVELTFPFQIQ